MSNSTTLLDTISSTQANKEVVVNALLDAASPGTMWGRHASTSAGLTWGYYGGNYQVGATANAVANGTLTLTASTTCYVFADNMTGAVSFNTTGVPAGKIALYTIVTGASTVTSYTDLRSYQPGGILPAGAGTVTSVGATGGVETDQTGGAAITTSGNVRTSVLLAGGAIQTATYAPVTGDRGHCVVMNSGSGVQLNLPTPTSGVTSNFPVGWWGELQNVGAGSTTVTVPSGLKLDNVTNGTFVIPQNQGISYFTDGTNWFTQRGVSTGSSISLATLNDVNVTEGAGIDGYALTWNNATSKWIATSISAGATTYAALTDVSLASLSNNQIPVYSTAAAKWKNQTLSLGPLALDAWNVSDMTTHGALSGGNLICTMATAPGSFSLVRGTVSHASGKWVFEASVSALSALLGAGIATTGDGVDSGSIPGQSDATGSLLRGDGFATAASGTHSNISAIANTPYMIAVDITNGLIWYRISNGNWNNSGTANPATGTGGLAITSGLTYFPCGVFSASGQAVTLNVGATSFSNTAPSGFSAWNANDTSGLQPSDVLVATPSVGQVLTWNGADWVNQTPSGGGGSTLPDYVNYSFSGGL